MSGARRAAWDCALFVLAVGAALTPDATGWFWLSAVTVATIGVGHGAFDLDLRTQPIVRAAIAYVAVALATLGLWLVAPPLALAVFLAASVWHFGQAELVHLRVRWRALGFVSRGLLLVGLPLFAHPGETEVITEALGVPLALPAWATASLAVACVAQHVLWLWQALPARRFFRELLGVAPAVVMLAALPLLVGFGLTFGLGHSAAHLRAVLRSRPPTAAYVRAGLFWLAALLGGVGLAFALGRTTSSTDLWAVAFVMLSALTMPHMVIVERWHHSR